MLDTRSAGTCQKCRVLEIAVWRACTDREKAEIEHAYTVYVTHLDEHSKQGGTASNVSRCRWLEA